MTWLVIGTDAVLGVFALMFLALWFQHRLRAVLAGAGVVVAYAVSEVVKLVVQEERPCRTAPSLAPCPEPGDWSFPSNHSVIAGASAMAIWALHRTWGWVAAVCALAAAASRVIVGVHYVHDVLAGLALGALVSWGIAVLLEKRQQRTVADAPTVVMQRLR
ncbi:phosphatase PAP2 family protein [Lentzea aerocolonigenes]|uniref:phosphatase PAP2 family protein n=1 Tax=Lentzea aerocolonigenes TaxID=68170 RepID=UPI00068F1BC6|nr:phosphatase PAP2 family protein [Lentzea aerocolonigenes]MCP2247216.1 undecaprenyl-diphosphatase [Lentzea aerocolonigenes]